MDGTGQARRLVDMVVVDAAGDWVGTVSEVYLDEGTGEPAWVTVRIGWFGHGSFVPLIGVDITGIRIRARYEKATITAAPRHDTCAPLTPAELGALYAHYGIAVPAALGSTPGSGSPAAMAGSPGLRRYIGTDLRGGPPSSAGARPRIDRDRNSVDADDDDTIIRSVN